MKKIIAYEILIIVAVLGSFFALVKLGSESFAVSIADTLFIITIGAILAILFSSLGLCTNDPDKDSAFAIIGIILITVSVVIALDAGAVILGAPIMAGKLTGNSLAIFLAIITAITATLGSTLIFSKKWTKDFSVLISSLTLKFLIILIPMLITVH